jgi:outer membrane protein assembly factor BamB
VEPTELEPRAAKPWRRYAVASLVVAIVFVAVGVGLSGGKHDKTAVGNDDATVTTAPGQLSSSDEGMDGANAAALSNGDASGRATTTSTVATQPSDESGDAPAPETTTSTTAERSTTTTAPKNFAGPPVDSVAYQLNAAHTGGHVDPDLPDDLSLLWKRDLNASMSYPLIVGDRIFAVGAPYDNGNPPIRLYAFDRRTGSDAWPSVEVGQSHFYSTTNYAYTAGLAYDAGRIYVANYDGDVRAFDPATGNEVWSMTLPGIDASSGAGISSMPTAKDGRVYVVSPTKVFAVAEANGALLWTTPVSGGGMKSAPAVSGGAVYVSVGGLDVYKLSAADGSQLWRTLYGSGGVLGGTTPVVFGDKVYARFGVPGFAQSGALSFPGDCRVLDLATGVEESTINSVFTPAFRGGVGVFVSDTRVATGRDLATGATLWTYPEDQAAPLVVNDDVVMQTGDERLVRVDRRTGEVRFTSEPGLVSAWPDENAPEWMQHGLAEGRGVVAATWGSGLSVFG